jgi:opacity protein-like surface antigen
VASVRGRLGWATDKMLLFATTGVAWASREAASGGRVDGGGDGAVGDPGQPGSCDCPPGLGGAGGAGGSASLDKNNEDEVGFVIGAGLETMVSEHLSIGMEGLYYFFEDGKAAIFDGDEKVDSFDTNNDLFVARARLTFHFNHAKP